MLKIFGGMALGMFLGTMLSEMVRKERPELFEAIEQKAKDVSDRLFENVREAYDFTETEALSSR